MDFLELVKERYSCRKISNKEVEQEKIDKIVEAARLAPTAVNFQPFKIWVIKSADKVAKVSESTRYTFGAPIIFAVGAKKEEAWLREYDHKNFADIDASIVATHIMLEIQQLGLGTTWVGYFDEDKLKSLFPEMKEYSIVALFPTGYPADDAEPSPRHSQRKDVKDLVKIL